MPLYRCAHCQQALDTQAGLPQPCPEHPDAAMLADLSATVYGEGAAQ